MMEENPVEMFRRTLEFTAWCKEHFAQRKKEGTDTSGAMLGLHDGQAEEIILLEKYPELKEIEMAMRTDQELYFEARNRALERHVEGHDFHREIEKAFVSGVEEYQIQPDRAQTETNYGFGLVLGLVAKLEAVKGKQYAGSWMKRGERDGALVNIQRKFDRLESALNGNENGESVVTTAADLMVYCGKLINRRAETHPGEFLKWIDEVRSL